MRQDKKKFEQWLKVWEEELPRKNIHFFYQDRPMGTFGALYPAHEWVGDETFLVSNGDDLKDIDLSGAKKIIPLLACISSDCR